MMLMAKGLASARETSQDVPCCHSDCSRMPQRGSRLQTERFLRWLSLCAGLYLEGVATVAHIRWHGNGLARVAERRATSGETAPRLDCSHGAVAGELHCALVTHLLNGRPSPCLNRPGNTAKSLPPLPYTCLLYTSPSPRDRHASRMPSSA